MLKVDGQHHQEFCFQSKVNFETYVKNKLKLLKKIGEFG